ncbi:hypothetical protein AK830_g10563 [Neonectria ditissima]|uniref:WSC domain-containing protein n=1 Tax=Neonectria ditissima TaxID=78410 RepID=A0A0P7APQ9_9HYPO|nr:hypothetical protein AK830_g10563 [Neonectria ditissima]
MRRFHGQHFLYGAACIPLSKAAFSVTAGTDASDLFRLSFGAAGLGSSDTPVCLGESSTGSFTDGPFEIGDGVILTTGNAVGALPGGDVDVDAGRSGSQYCTGETIYDEVVFTASFNAPEEVESLSFKYIFATAEMTPSLAPKRRRDSNEGSLMKRGAPPRMLEPDQMLIYLDGETLVSRDATSSDLTEDSGSSGMSYDRSTGLLTLEVPMTTGDHEMMFVVCDYEYSDRDSALLFNLKKNRRMTTTTTTTSMTTSSETTSETTTATTTTSDTTSETTTSTTTTTESTTSSTTDSSTESTTDSTTDFLTTTSIAMTLGNTTSSTSHTESTTSLSDSTTKSTTIPSEITTLSSTTITRETTSGSTTGTSETTSTATESSLGIVTPTANLGADPATTATESSTAEASESATAEFTSTPVSESSEPSTLQSADTTPSSNSSATTPDSILATSSATDPTTNLPAINGYIFIGCLGSSAGYPTFNEVGRSDDMTPALCVSLSQGKTYAGIVDNTCYAGESLADTGLVASGSCDIPCPGDPTLFCGGRLGSNLNPRAVLEFMLHRRGAPVDVLLTLFKRAAVLSPSPIATPTADVSATEPIIGRTLDPTVTPTNGLILSDTPGADGATVTITPSAGEVIVTVAPGLNNPDNIVTACGIHREDSVTLTVPVAALASPTPVHEETAEGLEPMGENPGLSRTKADGTYERPTGTSKPSEKSKFPGELPDGSLSQPESDGSAAGEPQGTLPTSSSPHSDSGMLGSSLPGPSVSADDGGHSDDSLPDSSATDGDGEESNSSLPGSSSNPVDEKSDRPRPTASAVGDEETNVHLPGSVPTRPVGGEPDDSLLASSTAEDFHPEVPLTSPAGEGSNSSPPVSSWTGLATDALGNSVLTSTLTGLPASNTGPLVVWGGSVENRARFGARSNHGLAGTEETEKPELESVTSRTGEKS